MRRDQRSAKAAAYRWLYGTTAWQALRAQVLDEEPFCQRCSTDKRLVPSTTVNHKRPHRGDRILFFQRTNCEAVCAPCHDGPIQRAERRGFSGAVDALGFPTDPLHPANRAVSGPSGWRG